MAEDEDHARMQRARAVGLFRYQSAAGPCGFGLVGMTERITLLGGTLTAGPNPDRGWIVRAVLPRRGAAT